VPSMAGCIGAVPPIQKRTLVNVVSNGSRPRPDLAYERKLWSGSVRQHLPRCRPHIRTASGAARPSAQRRRGRRGQYRSTGCRR
jgi:hypothetical protein